MVNNIYNGLIVVVRYFGGSLLGVSGLINAYKCAAADAVKNAGMVERYEMKPYQAEFPVEELSNVMRVLKECGATLGPSGFEHNYKIDFSVRKSSAELMERKMSVLYKVLLRAT